MILPQHVSSIPTPLVPHILTSYEIRYISNPIQSPQLNYSLAYGSKSLEYAIARATTLDSLSNSFPYLHF
jgi:hypothetical protein